MSISVSKADANVEHPTFVRAQAIASASRGRLAGRQPQQMSLVRLTDLSQGATVLPDETDKKPQLEVDNRLAWALIFRNATIVNLSPYGPASGQATLAKFYDARTGAFIESVTLNDL